MSEYDEWDEKGGINMRSTHWFDTDEVEDVVIYHDDMYFECGNCGYVITRYSSEKPAFCPECMVSFSHCVYPGYLES